MNATLRTLAFGAAIAAVFAPAAANAVTLSFACTEKIGDKDASFTASYAGDASGTLTVKLPDGQMALPARYVEQDAGNWGIDAAGPATVIMPDKAALEACLAAKAQPGDLNDANTVTFLVAGCQGAVAAGAAPVAITAEVQIAAIDGDINAFMSRKYNDATPVAGGHLEVASFPPPVCAQQ